MVVLARTYSNRYYFAADHVFFLLAIIFAIIGCASELKYTSVEIDNGVAPTVSGVFFALTGMERCVTVSGTKSCTFTKYTSLQNQATLVEEERKYNECKHAGRSTLAFLILGIIFAALYLVASIFRIAINLVYLFWVPTFFWYNAMLIWPLTCHKNAIDFAGAAGSTLSTGWAMCLVCFIFSVISLVLFVLVKRIYVTPTTSSVR